MQTAKTHMEKAVAEAQKEGCRVTDSEVAEHHYRLGRVLWSVGGKFQTDPNKAMASLEAASLEENDSQVCTSDCSKSLNSSALMLKGLSANILMLPGLLRKSEAPSSRKLQAMRMLEGSNFV